MFVQSAHPVTNRWPAANPSVLQLFSFPTPNGVKVSIALEETGLPYEAHTVTLSRRGCEKPGVFVAQPEQQDPGHPRSKWSRRETAAIVRKRRNPDLSCRENRSAFARRSRTTLSSAAMGDVPDGWRRPDVLATWLFLTNSQAPKSKIRARASAMSTRRNDC